MSEIAYINGQFISRENAKISPDDRGFIFADGIYEVVKYYQGKPFRFDDHISRLKRSLAEIGLKFKVEGLRLVFDQLLQKNGLQNSDAGVYWQITRGAHKRIHHFPEMVEPTIYAFAFEFPSNTEKLENGIKVVTSDDIRWLRCDIKSISLLPNTMLYNKAVECGAEESVLIRDGFVTEATHSSVLAVKDGQVITHPLSNLVLPGITRKVVQEICLKNQIVFEERAFSEQELYKMDELFITGTGSEITPVVQVNDTLIGSEKPGPVTRLIQENFFKLVE